MQTTAYNSASGCHEKGKMVVKKLMSLIKEEPFDGEERLPVELVVRDSVQNRE